MDISTIGNIITGGVFKDVGLKVLDTIIGRFPEKMSDEDRHQAEIEVMKIVNEKEIEALKQWNEQERNFQKFITDMEGTSAALKQMPIIGRAILFLRGAFRPLMAFGIAYTDLQVFSGGWNLQEVGGAQADQVWSLLYVINFLVIGFYFGERALRNLQPLIEKMMDRVIGGEKK